MEVIIRNKSLLSVSNDVNFVHKILINASILLIKLHSANTKTQIECIIYVFFLDFKKSLLWET